MRKWKDKEKNMIHNTYIKARIKTQLLEIKLKDENQKALDNLKKFKS